jgi:hypothetical protein
MDQVKGSSHGETEGGSSTPVGAGSSQGTQDRAPEGGRFTFARRRPETSQPEEGAPRQEGDP